MKPLFSGFKKLGQDLALTALIVLLFRQYAGFSAPQGANDCTAVDWPNSCGDGRADRILDDFNEKWTFCCTADPSIPTPNLRIVDGCHGNAMAVGYDLTNASKDGQSWIVLQKELKSAIDLTNLTHIRLAIKGSNPNSHDNVEVKLYDGKQLYTASLKSIADLPVWRSIYLDFREFAGGTGNKIDLTNISRLEIALVRCIACEVIDDPDLSLPNEQHYGTLYFDEFAAVDLKPGAANRLVESDFESVVSNPSVRDGAASALLSQVTPAGPGADLIPAWFPQVTPNYNTYAESEALLVFIYEYELTHKDEYRQKANNLAKKLLSLQIPPGKDQSGAWYTAYTIRDQTLMPAPNRALSNQSCDGNEKDVRDIDTCEWVGNVGWALIALSKLQRSGFYDDPAALKTAVLQGLEWIIRQVDRDKNFPGLISQGIEGNISAYFGLLASGYASEATKLGKAIFRFGWDPVQGRLKTGAGAADAATAMDVSGSWGSSLLRSMGMKREALESQGYAASVLRISSFDGTIHGYGDIAGPFTPAVEFTAQAAAAGIKDADCVMKQIYPLQIKPGGSYPGAFPGAPDDWYGGTLPPWNTTMPGVSPTAWVYYALSYDPLVEIALPGKATLGSPSNSISSTTPSYTWNAVSSASWYYLWVNDGSASPKIQQWYTADQAGCSSETATCTVTPGVALTVGNCQWWIRTWNNAGYGPWSDGMKFSVVAGGVPGKATLISPSGDINTTTLVYTWNAVPLATWYYLWVEDASAVPRIQKWYTSAQAGCASGTGTCSITPTTALALGDHQWWIQTWNDQGYGPWSDGMKFMVTTGGTPGKATLVSPTGNITTTTPAYIWNAVSTATWYYLWVNDNTGAPRIQVWYKAAEAGCASGSGQCSVTPGTGLTLGSGQWWIQTWNDAGYGPWSDPFQFIVIAASNSWRGIP